MGRCTHARASVGSGSSPVTQRSVRDARYDAPRMGSVKSGQLTTRREHALLVGLRVERTGRSEGCLLRVGDFNCADPVV